MRLRPALRPLYRAQLAPEPQPRGPSAIAFARPAFRLVYGFCERSASSETMRRYIGNGDLLALARAHPGIEMVVRRRPGRHPIVKACYSPSSFR